MRRTPVFAAAFTVALAVTAPVAEAAPAQHGHAQRVCSAAPAGFAACNAWIDTDAVPAAAAAMPSGLGPADLLSAYNLGTLAGSAGAGRTIAIVDAYDAPTAFADVNVYRAQYGIPALASCTPSSVDASTTPCFAKADQSGGTTYPRKDGGWAQEISLDLDMTSAICPKCNILLVEATTPSMANLGTAVNTAVGLGAEVVSNSYGGSEYSGETTDESQYFNHPGVAVTVSSGDSGYGVEFPAASRYVTAVGGTSLTKASNTRGWSETAWSGAGSGCSAYVAKPSWQSDSGCGKRTVADVSAVADPATGVAVYDSTAYQGRSGWMVFGGTSVAAPLVGGVYALGGVSGVTGANTVYSHTSSLYDVSGGSNGSCGGGYLCTAVTGYDGPTGLGTPNGAAAF
ncbi:S53 family peptidase [Amycolatopsis australiensis]|uniref:Subtilase family protein n=1 Tax=Amycolatopsis australiensis TaxID=546364 RepID=A0A1K1SUB9_9PSEU|nr:S8 family serine peptidase [Amycolatopsis australiensis]SFW87836.1 Subtilase family protein [Amycolatopsis australiensis]